jgi:cobalt/nickel transport system permease protein
MKSFLDIRAKLLITVITIFFIVSVPNGGYEILGFYLLLCIIIAFLFKPDFIFFIKKFARLFLIPLFISIFIPFAGKGQIIYEFGFKIIKLQLTDNGLNTFFSVLIKSFLSLLLLCSMITSTNEREIFWGLRKLYVPKIVVSIIFLMYRYLFLFKDEFSIGQKAINARVFRKPGFAINKNLSYLIGSLFIRSYLRAENIFMAMQSRGFDGNFYLTHESPKIKKSSIAVISFLMIFNIAIRSMSYINVFNYAKFNLF